MGRKIELQTADGATIGAYRASPSAKPKGGIVVVQEIFGVNHHIRSVTDRFADAGFEAVAPAIFDRVEPGVELAYDETGMERGRTLASKISLEQNVQAIEAAITALAASGPVAVVGFCLGGSLAFAAATRAARLAAAVGYYGGNIASMAGAPVLCPTLLHFGEDDAHIPQTDVEKIRRAYPDMPIHTYPGAGHGFNCDARASFDQASADLAWRRTMTFLDDAMAGR